jgi:hypothetical protein
LRLKDELGLPDGFIFRANIFWAKADESATDLKTYMRKRDLYFNRYRIYEIEK